MRKGINQEKNTCINIKNSTGRVMTNDDERKDSWGEYFDKLYNVGKQKETNMNMICFEGVVRNMYWM